jgi:hypothetical protein
MDRCSFHVPLRLALRIIAPASPLHSSRVKKRGTTVPSARTSKPPPMPPSSISGSHSRKDAPRRSPRRVVANDDPARLAPRQIAEPVRRQNPAQVFVLGLFFCAHRPTPAESSPGPF